MFQEHVKMTQVEWPTAPIGKDRHGELGELINHWLQQSQLWFRDSAKFIQTKPEDAKRCEARGLSLYYCAMNLGQLCGVELVTPDDLLADAFRKAAMSDQEWGIRSAVFEREHQASEVSSH